MKRKISTLFCLVFFSTFVKGQKVLPNTLIGKKEVEYNISFLGSRYSEISLGEIIYRFHASKNLKIGPGAKIFWGDLNNPDYTQFNIYPGIFLDGLYFVGKTKRQKWGISLQTGYEFYKMKIGDYPGVDDTGPYTVKNSVLKSGFYAMAGASHRAILSSKLQLVTGGFLSLQRTVQKGTYTNVTGTKNYSDKRNNFGGGIKVGLVIRLGNCR